MHAFQIIQQLLITATQKIHAKRIKSIAKVVQAGCRGMVTLIGLSRYLPSKANDLGRINMVDRLIGNTNLQFDKYSIYAELAKVVLKNTTHPAILIDWSDLTEDQSMHLLRASVTVQGRSFTIYEEVHPTKELNTSTTHKKFIKALKRVLPSDCEPIIVSDAGFRATWFKMLDEEELAWIGRIRNRDMVHDMTPDTDDREQNWHRGTDLYADATSTPKDLGEHDYAKSNPVRCRLTLIKKAPAGRHHKTKLGNKAASKKSKQNAKAQTDPWLLAVSPKLKDLTAERIVKIYSGRMQIEQTFRDTKNPYLGLGLSKSQTHGQARLTALVMIAALVTYALWIIGLTAKQSGFKVEYGSRKKRATTLSIISLAMRWLEVTKTKVFSKTKLRQSHETLNLMVFRAY